MTFLFTDIVDSTRLWEQHPQAMPQVLVRHDALVRAAIAAHGGVVFKTLGDTICTAFWRAPDALAAAYAAQQALHAEKWINLGLPPVGAVREPPVRVRMALHTGAADPRTSDYVGPPLNRVARILAASHGEQILLSHTTRDLVADTLPDGLALRDLGTYQLAGMHGTGLSRPEPLFQLVSPELPAEFPPPITLPTAIDSAPTVVAPLLATKLTPPQRAQVTPRPRLIERLRQMTEHPLTLVVAPPGFGKTTLLAAWIASLSSEFPSGEQTQNSKPWPEPSRRLRTQNFSVAWLTLDEADNDPMRFWSYLIGALEQRRPGISADAAALLHAPQLASIDTVLTMLVNAIAATPGQLALVLDDFHVINAAAIHRALATLIAYLPPNFHLVIASRADLSLPLARLRARGQVAEIRATDLRCTPDEAALFLRAMLGRDLAPADIAGLLERTEGWIAGLQLAALSLQDAPDAAGQIAALRGENRYIWDYLVDEVLDRQPHAVRRFLLHTAFLDRMCAELCDAVLPIENAELRIEKSDLESGHSQFSILNSQSMLETLESANLFIVPLDTERRWYRYHRLFADVLRLRLRQLHPELVAPIHQRAAVWYRRSGLTADAIQHALAAQDWDVAAEYIEESAEALLMHGEITTLLRWVRTLPPDVPQRQPRLSLLYAAALVTIGQLDEADTYMRMAERASEAKQSTAGDRLPGYALAAGELDTMKAVLAGSRGDLSGAMAYAHAALAELPQERTLFRLAATMVLGAYGWMRGDTNQTLRFIERQLALDAPTGNELLHAWANTLLVYVQHSQGKLRLASQTCWRLLAPSADRGDMPLLTAGAAAARLSEISYEWNDLEAAMRFAREGIALSRRFGSPEQESFNLAALALALQAQGDAAGARAAIEQALKLVQPQPVERAVVATYQARLWLIQGDLALAAAWAQACAPRPDDTIAYLRVLEQLAQARVYLAQGGAQVAQAFALLLPLLRDAEAQGQFGHVIEACALLALVHAATTDASQALDRLARALELAAPEGYIRLFTDLGAPMKLLIADCRTQIARKVHADSIARTGNLLAYVDKLLAAFPDIKAQVGNERASNGQSEIYNLQSAMVEPLSARELEVLRLVAAGQSNQAIAQSLIIAESTVKMHLKNIYGKLGAHSRTQAIARARELGLL